MRKVLIVGHARHGKDTAAEYLAQKLGTSYRGSSEICAEWIYKIITPKYATVTDCFNDRVNNRKLWHQLIKAYCMSDKAALGKLIYNEVPIYCGIRDSNELKAVIAEFDPLVIWVDASKRLPLESKESMNIEFEDSFIYMSNNNTEEEFLEDLSLLVATGVFHE